MMFSEVFCDPSEIQTRNRRLRRALLYSVELRGQIKEVIIRSRNPKSDFNRSTLVRYAIDQVIKSYNDLQLES